MPIIIPCQNAFLMVGIKDWVSLGKLGRSRGMVNAGRASGQGFVVRRVLHRAWGANPVGIGVTAASTGEGGVSGGVHRVRPQCIQAAVGRDSRDGKCFPYL